MSIENQNQQLPLDSLSDADLGHFAAIGDALSAGDHVAQVRMNDARPEDIAQANIDFEAAEIARHAAQREARRHDRKGAATAVSKLLFRRR